MIPADAGWQHSSLVFACLPFVAPRPAPRKALRLFCRAAKLCVVLFALGACAPLSTPFTPRVPAPDDQAQQRWELFEQSALAREQKPAPFRMSGSLRFGLPDNTQRVTYMLWGNASPVRLDITAGMGTTAAKVRAHNGFLLAFIPSENKAYIMEDAPGEAFNALGLPLPLGLDNLTKLLQGFFMQALGRPEASHPFLAEDGQGIIYQLQGGNVDGELELQPNGLPSRWSSPDGWNVQLSYAEGTALPTKLEGVLPTGYKMTLLIKERQYPQQFSAEQTGLLIPSSVPVYSIEKKQN